MWNGGHFCFLHHGETVIYKCIITNLKHNRKKTKPVFVKNSKHLDDEQTIIPLTNGCGTMPVIDIDCKEQVIGIHPAQKGYFAVLLKAGMTVKQALIYSTVSTVLAFIGMVIGVLIGNIGDSITWVYISVAGMFLYIALIDMLPELTTVNTKQGGTPLFHLVLQVMGMILWVSILLLIALYEKTLMNILKPV